MACFWLAEVIEFFLYSTLGLFFDENLRVRVPALKCPFKKQSCSFSEPTMAGLPVAVMERYPADCPHVALVCFGLRRAAINSQKSSDSEKAQLHTLVSSVLQACAKEQRLLQHIFQSAELWTHQPQIWLPQQRLRASQRRPSSRTLSQSHKLVGCLVSQHHLESTAEHR